MNARPAPRLLGVDACRGGWVIAWVEGRGSTPVSRTRREPWGPGAIDLGLERDFSSVLARAGSDGIVAIDMPIGLPDGEPRTCDQEARAVLGPRRASSVFPAPVRRTLAATTYADACAASLDTCGRALSQQTFHLLPRIRDVDAVVTPALQQRIREVHPEVVFASLAGGAGLAAPKRRPEGHALRLALLATALGPLPNVGEARRRLGRSAVGLDDLVDALACLVAAGRIAAGSARRLPAAGAPRDARGLLMEICF